MPLAHWGADFSTLVPGLDWFVGGRVPDDSEENFSKAGRKRHRLFEANAERFRPALSQ